MVHCVKGSFNKSFAFIACVQCLKGELSKTLVSILGSSFRETVPLKYEKVEPPLFLPPQFEFMLISFFYGAVQCSAVQCSAVQCSAVQRSAVQYCTYELPPSWP